jgi:NADP-dependent 3-hydroxy acid dehydrogenase YdfG
VRRVVVADRNEELLQKFRSQLTQTYADADIEIAVVDVNVEEQVKAMVAQAVDKWGRIDYCLNAAGVAGGGGKIGETSLEDVSVLGVTFAFGRRPASSRIPLPLVSRFLSYLQR